MDIKKIQSQLQLFRNLQDKAQITPNIKIELMFSKRDFININGLNIHVQIGTDEIEDFIIRKKDLFNTEQNYIIQIKLKNNNVYIELNDNDKNSKYLYEIHNKRGSEIWNQKKI